MKLAVLTCHYNPCGYVQLRRNLFRFLRQMEGEGVPVFVAELAYDDEPWVLVEAPNVLRFRTARRNLMWHKENLLNCLERMVPPEFDALAWIDADVWFQNAHWYEYTMNALSECAVVQPFDYAVWTARDGQPEMALRGAAVYGSLAPGKAAPGLAWAAQRELWTEGGGLAERAIIGGGDVVNASAWLPTEGGASPWFTYANYPATVTRLRRWAEKAGGCGHVEGTLWHEWHGGQADRAYVGRYDLVRELNLEKDLRHREDGLLEFSDEVPEGIPKRIGGYFTGRNEDGESVGQKVWMHASELAVMERLLRSTDRVLEFGSGGSTLWLARRVAAVETIEHDQAWAARVLAVVPENVTLHWRRPEWAHTGRAAAEPGQFANYLRVTEQLGGVFDACLIDGRARVEAARRVARVLRPGGWLFFHDWFARERYRDRLGEMREDYALCEELSVTGTTQTLAVFRRMSRRAGE